MQPTLTQKLCCPFDKADLHLQIFLQDTSGNIVEGLLTCNECSRYYPIVYGVPIMSPDEYRQELLEAPLVKKWANKIEEKNLQNFRLSSSAEAL